MNKDVIYIDVDDDVTAIIGKVKKANEKIVALVPPKRVGALQSAVNLRLLDRMAKAEHKRLVLITNNQALIALAANAQIPVAKNLQTKPEIANIPALIVDDGDDIIDGSELPVGEHAGTVRVSDATRGATEGRSKAIDETNLDIDGEDGGPVPSAGAEGMGAVAATAVGAKAAKAKKGPKIPNFDSFRKRLVLIIAGGAALIALLVWMFVFAPAATVVITAKTSPQPISSAVKLGGTQATDYKTGVISSIQQQQKTDETIDFEATGQKDVGEKASGTITITNCDGGAFTLSAGTKFTASSGQAYTSTAAVTVSALSGSASLCRTTGANAGTGQVGVVAAASGTDYNIDAKSYSIAGVSGDIYAKGTAMSGGTSKVARVVSADDVERAKGELLGRSTDTQKKAILKKFTDAQVAIDSSFTVDRGAQVSAPAVDQEAADGKAKLTIPTTYTMYGVAKSDIDTYLKASIGAKIDGNTQKIYNSGASSATLSNFRKDGEAVLATLNATGRVGPKIDEAAVKDQVKGKIYGEVQQALQSQEGINSVDVQFSYFWVRTVPGDTNKITIEFKVADE